MILLRKFEKLTNFKGFLLMTVFLWAAALIGRADPSVQKIEANNMMKTKTICVGRLMIDVPEEAIPRYRPGEIAGWSIASDADQSDDDFTQSLLEADASARLGDPSADRGGLEAAYEINDAERRGKIFVFGRATSEDYDNGKSTKLVWMSMHARFRSNGVSYTISSDFKSEADLAELKRLVVQTHHRNNDELPEAPGICLDRALLLDPLPDRRAETTTLAFELPSHPDTAVVVAIMGGVQSELSLLDRSAKSDLKRKFSSRFHFLRQQKRTIAGWAGEEQIRRVYEFNGVTVRSAFWEFSGSKDDMLRPFISLEMRTGLGRQGEPVNSTFTDEELLAWWDKVSPTLRVRPSISRPVAVTQPRPQG